MAYIFIISRMILRLKNLRARSESCDPPRSVLVTGFPPENGHHLPVISWTTEVDHKTVDSDLALKFFNRKIMREMIKI